MNRERVIATLRDIEVDATQTARNALILRTALEMDPDALDGARLVRRVARLEADGDSHREEVVMVVEVVKSGVKPWWRRWLGR